MNPITLDPSAAGLGLGAKRFFWSLFKTALLASLVFAGAQLANFTVPAQYQTYAEVITAIIALLKALVAFGEGWLGTRFGGTVTQ